MSGLGIKSIIFDMDGLVLDSEATYFAAWRQAALEMGHELDQRLSVSLSGKHGDQVKQGLIDYFGSDFEIERFYDLSSQYWREQVQQQGIPVKAGFFLLLRQLQKLGLPFCLASNSRRPNVIQCLEYAGLNQVFPFIICRDDVENPKPAPDLFLASAASMQMAGENCLVLEDSPVGIAAAVAANCPCIFVPSQLPIDPQAARCANRVVSSLEQVADLIVAGFLGSL